MQIEMIRVAQTPFYSSEFGKDRSGDKLDMQSGSFDNYHVKATQCLPSGKPSELIRMRHPSPH